ncbi:MAG: universal stress protein [Paracoccaceae bacterium]
MWFKSVLTVITNTGQAEAAINAASRMALGNEGHLNVLAVGIDRTQLGFSDMGAGSMLTQMSMEQADGDAKLASDAATAALTEQDPALRWGLQTEVAQLGELSVIVGTAARYVDLVVQCLPYGTNRGFDAEAVVEAALFEGHAPVLIVPDGTDVTSLANPKRIIVAWDDSPEALNAAKRALPLLRGADRVEVTVVDPASVGTEPGALLCQFLVRHGVKAEVTALPRNLPTVAEVLQQHALDQNADMLVMGAYGHSRLREAIFGGSTRSMLEHSKIPVFMSR